MSIFSRVSRLADVFRPVKESTNPFVEVTSKPTKHDLHWYRVLTLSGKDGGLGFACEKCHLHIKHSAPKRVFHCGQHEELSIPVEKLPVRNLDGGSFRQFMFVDWDDS